ncbi:Galactinol synthase 2 [Cocos nucifera]|uniref:Hexosyltransferase n=1 Tax=Cocos nucifera TaxID=13894 RepID=A0A8K0HSR8_COCNU|nr:Galactinol synthase 2 [Cocos nucifera]
MAPEINGRDAAAVAKMGMHLPRRAYVTFLAGTGDYVKGAVGLAKGLRKVGSAYPLVVAVLPDVPEDHRRLLESQCFIVWEIEPIYPPENQTKFAMAYYVINYSKLRVWEADIQVCDNIDELFDLPDGYFYAVMDCFCERTWSHTTQYRVGYCQQCPERVAWSAAELGPQSSLYFNAGMFVFEPSIATANALLATLKVTDPAPFAEQGSKPWRYTGEEENMDRADIKELVRRWWDVYNDESLNYEKPTAGAGGGSMDAGEAERRPFLAAPSST